MTDVYPGFHEFERTGWEDPEVVSHYAEEVASITRQSNGALLDAAGVRAGSRVLDVACGPGFLSAAAAERGASVVGVDFSSAQVSAARGRHPRIRFELADAIALPFTPGSFDAVLCGFAMLHFPDALAAASEARRVLVPGGRFAFTVWDTLDRAVAMGAIQRAIRAHGDLHVDVPAGPDFFGLSDPERSERLLLDAGFDQAVVGTITQTWRVPSPEHIFDAFLHSTVRTRALLRAQSAERAAAIRSALRGQLTAYRRGDHYELPMPALLATGTKGS